MINSLIILPLFSVEYVGLLTSADWFGSKSAALYMYMMWPSGQNIRLPISRLGFKPHHHLCNCMLCKYVNYMSGACNYVFSCKLNGKVNWFSICFVINKLKLKFRTRRIQSSEDAWRTHAWLGTASCDFTRCPSSSLIRSPGELCNGSASVVLRCRGPY